MWQALARRSTEMCPCGAASTTVRLVKIHTGSPAPQAPLGNPELRTQVSAPLDTSLEIKVEYLC